MESKRIGFIGAGQMAEALARGFVNKGIIKAGNVYATDIMQVRKDVFSSFGANAVDSNSEVVANSDVVFIAVKPQYVAVVLKEVQPVLKGHHVIVSIAAGVTLETLKVRLLCTYCPVLWLPTITLPETGEWSALMWSLIVLDDTHDFHVLLIQFLYNVRVCRKRQGLP